MARDFPEVKLLTKNAEIDAFLEELQAESDRAAAILGATMLDEQLKKLLSATFVSAASADELLGQMKPIATFSSRTSLARAIGLVSVEEHQDLTRIRKICNDFAHELNGLTFNSDSIQRHCEQLNSARHALAKPTNALIAEAYPQTNRTIFNLAVALNMVLLNKRIKGASRIAVATVKY